MSKYLFEIEAKTRLRLGKSIAQFLSYQDEEDYTILKWLTIGIDEGKKFAVYYHEVFDEGDDNDYNMFEFSAVNSDEFPFGIINEFDTADEAMEFASNFYGALNQRYVAESMINEEYAEYRAKDE